MTDLTWLVVIGLLLYGGQLYLRQRSIIFRPTAEQFGTPCNLGLRFEEVFLERRVTEKMHAWWIPAAHAEHVIIFFHGTSGNMSHELRTLSYLHALGQNVLTIDYPGYGRSTGSPSQSGCFAAADAAWAFVTEQRHFTPDRVVVYGRSLGAAVAAYLASRWQCRGLVFQSGFTSVPDMAAKLYPFLPARWFVHTRLDAVKFVRECRCPVLVLHSETDEFVSFTMAQGVFDQARRRKKLVRLHGRHLSSQWQSDRRVLRAWRELLSGEATHLWYADAEKLRTKKKLARAAEAMRL